MSKITSSTAKWCVAVCRPDPQGKQLAKRLTDIGYDAIAQPLFDIEAQTNSEEIKQILATKQPNIIIFISPAAVKFAQKALPIKNWKNIISRPIIYMAVGKTTQTALRHCGINKVIVPKQENSEGMLALAELNHVNNENVLIIRGDKGRELLATTLTTRGANVTYLASYRKVWRKLTADKLALQWQKHKINAIVVTSVALLENLLALLTTTQAKEYWLEHCYWLVASERIAKQAKRHNINKVINTCGANTQAIMTTISTMDLNND